MAELSVGDKQPIDEVEQNMMRDTPPTPPSPEDLESAGEKLVLSRTPVAVPDPITRRADSKASRKREREVSIEPATPKVRVRRVCGRPLQTYSSRDYRTVATLFRRTSLPLKNKRSAGDQRRRRIVSY